jgi:hypothetical protein
MEYVDWESVSPDILYYGLGAPFKKTDEVGRKRQKRENAHQNRYCAPTMKTWMHNQ